MAAAIGNQYAAKAKVWSAAIQRVLADRTASRLDQRNALDDLAAALIDKAAEGDMGALRELGDRLDGKPAQAVSLGNTDGNPFQIAEIVRTIVRPDNPNG